jgi:hypothetical protein
LNLTGAMNKRWLNEKWVGFGQGDLVYSRVKSILKNKKGLNIVLSISAGFTEFTVLKKEIIQSRFFRYKKGVDEGSFSAF